MAVIALVVEELVYVHFLEEAHDRLRIILQVDPFMEGPFKEGPLAIRLPMQVMDGMEGDITDTVLMVLEAGMRRGMAMVPMLELSGAG